MRAGDRYWYQNVFSGRELHEIENTRLSDIIERNTDIEGLQENVFFQRGRETLRVSTADSGATRISVRQRAGRVEIVDSNQQRVLASRPLAEVGRIEIAGADAVRERITIDSSLSAVSGGMRIVVDGGSGPKDTLVVAGTSGDDTITVSGNVVSMADLDVIYQDVEMLILQGHEGDDILDAKDSDAPVNILDGGRGDDILEGSVNNDRMFGGDGRDVLRGGDGDDFMSGGRGNDRLYGQRGVDRMNGGMGNDIVIQNGNGNSSADARRMSAFLQDTLRIRDTGNNFENWGGLGERWYWSMAERAWLFLTPEGSLFRWDGSAGASGESIAELGSEVFADPGMLTNAGRPMDDDNRHQLNELVGAVQEQLLLRPAGNLFRGWAGFGEIWLWGRSGWYFLTSDGMLYEYDSNAEGIPGNLVAELPTEVFDNPSLFTSQNRGRRR